MRSRGNKPQPFEGREMVEIRFCDRCEHIYLPTAIYCGEEDKVIAKGASGYCCSPLSSVFFKDREEAREWLRKNFKHLSNDQIDEVIAILFV